MSVVDMPSAHRAGDDFTRTLRRCPYPPAQASRHPSDPYRRSTLTGVNCRAWRTARQREIKLHAMRWIAHQGGGVVASLITHR